MTTRGSSRHTCNALDRKTGERSHATTAAAEGKLEQNLEPSQRRYREMAEFIGSPGWARTSDFLINRRGPAKSRLSVFLRSSAQTSAAARVLVARVRWWKGLSAHSRTKIGVFDGCVQRKLAQAPEPTVLRTWFVRHAAKHGFDSPMGSERRFHSSAVGCHVRAIAVVLILRGPLVALLDRTRRVRMPWAPRASRPCPAL